MAVCCLLVSAFVSGSEIAFFGLDSQQTESLNESEDPRAEKVLNLLHKPEKLLATILIANNLVNITMVVLLTFAINAAVTFINPTLNFLIQTVLLTFLLLLFGEILPKLVARNFTMQWVLLSSSGVEALVAVFRPFANLMVGSSKIVRHFVSVRREKLTTDQLEKALEISDIQEGQEKEMLEGILTFGETEVSEIMTSRVDVTDIEFHTPFSEVVKTILDSGYSRIPVYDTSRDSIRGILYSKDLLPYIGKRDDSFRWQTLIRQPYFVPESRMIDDLLEDFRRKKIHIAIVIDEYGGTLGIVTLEDIIEEIIGEIDDEYDERKSMFRRLSPNTYIFDAKVPISEFCRDVGIEEESLGDIGDAETLAGLLLEIKGDFPERKESFIRGCCRFLVIEIERHRITKVRVSIDPSLQQQNS
ncbi:MAG: gliding motility-associated protein GldE [Bacteroides sp.]|nr:gliding motility-associated protein GldE [Bacteroides sp.]MBD5307377.1 gliding motility-associated protein GldE [Bacteroides sp.]